MSATIVLLLLAALLITAAFGWMKGWNASKTTIGLNDAGKPYLMKTLSPAKIKALIKANNAKWKAATPAQRRVLIARDVIARVKSQQYSIETMVYCEIDAHDDKPASAQTAIVGKSATCRCCARGAVFFSYVAFRNQAQVHEIGHPKDCKIGASNTQNRLGLDGVFPLSQQQLMEAAFEGWDARYARYAVRRDNKFASEETRKFAERHPSADERLLAICQNIVKNKGQFILPTSDTAI